MASVSYAVPFGTAMEKKWNTFGMRAMGASGNFVEFSTFVKDEHRFLKVPTLPPVFYEQGTTELIFPGLDRILSKGSDGPELFVNTWSERQWFTNSAEVGHIAERMKIFFDAKGKQKQSGRP